MPVHHLLEQILNEYIVAAGIQSVQPLSAIGERAAGLYDEDPPICTSIHIAL